MTRSGIARLTIWTVIILLGLACLGFAVPLQAILLLAFGWILFLWNVLPQATVDASGAATGMVALALLVIGLHLFLRWFHSAMGDSATRAWRFRWTASIVTIVLMMFVAGVSMVGITHELAWLATSPEVIVENSGARTAARRMQSSNNLHNLVLGIRDYEASHDGQPPQIKKSEDGQALHGWQTAILPSLDPDLYKQVDMNQSWDSSRNADAMKRRVRIFQLADPRLPRKNSTGYALSHYAGNVHVMGGKRPPGTRGIADGASNTLFIGEAAGNYRPWGYPHNVRDPLLGINQSPDGFGSPWPGGALFAFADGRVQFLSEDIDPQVLRALATPAGGEKVGDY